MIEGTSKNMPFNVQVNIERIQENKRKEQVNALERLNDYQLTQYRQAQYREQQRWLVYIMMMQLMFKLNCVYKPKKTVFITRLLSLFGLSVSEEP